MNLLPDFATTVVHLLIPVYSRNQNMIWKTLKHVLLEDTAVFLSGFYEQVGASNSCWHGEAGNDENRSRHGQQMDKSNHDNKGGAATAEVTMAETVRKCQKQNAADFGGILATLVPTM